MNKTRVHIIKRDHGWAIKKEGDLKASKVYNTKEDARLQSLAYRAKGHDIVIHNSDGSIEKWEKAKK
jgi:hypothetical protein